MILHEPGNSPRDVRIPWLLENFILSMENHMVDAAILLVRKQRYFEYFYWFLLPFINKN